MGPLESAICVQVPSLFCFLERKRTWWTLATPEPLQSLSRQPHSPGDRNRTLGLAEGDGHLLNFMFPLTATFRVSLTGGSAGFSGRLLFHLCEDLDAFRCCFSFRDFFCFHWEDTRTSSHTFPGTLKDFSWLCTLFRVAIKSYRQQRPSVIHLNPVTEKDTEVQ